MNLNATLLGEMITFSIFIWFTMRFVMPPVMQALEERRAQAAETVENNTASKRKLKEAEAAKTAAIQAAEAEGKDCLLYTSPSPRDVEESRMPSSA